MAFSHDIMAIQQWKNTIKVVKSKLPVFAFYQKFYYKWEKLIADEDNMWMRKFDFVYDDKVVTIETTDGDPQPITSASIYLRFNESTNEFLDIMLYGMYPGVKIDGYWQSMIDGLPQDGWKYAIPHAQNEEIEDMIVYPYLFPNQKIFVNLD